MFEFTVRHRFISGCILLYRRSKESNVEHTVNIRWIRLRQPLSSKKSICKGFIDRNFTDLRRGTFPNILNFKVTLSHNVQLWKYWVFWTSELESIRHKKIYEAKFEVPIEIQNEFIPVSENMNGSIYYASCIFILQTYRRFLHLWICTDRQKSAN